MSSSEEAVRSLRCAEPTLGVKKILERLQPLHPDLDTRTVRAALASAITPPATAPAESADAASVAAELAAACEPPREGRYLYGMPNTAEVNACLLGKGSAPYVCGHCMKSSANLKPCGRCSIARYCSQECQEKMHSAHVGYCKAVACKSASVNASVKRLAQAVQCFAKLGITAETAERWTYLQRQRFSGICAMICSHARGQPANVISEGSVESELLDTCIKCAECSQDCELLQCPTELHVREFVISGLCFTCQAQSLHLGKLIAGPSAFDEPASAIPDELKEAVAVLMSKKVGWHWLQTDVSYRSIHALSSTPASLWSADLARDRPELLVVANESFVVRRFWHKLSDGSVHIAAGRRDDDRARAEYKRRVSQMARRLPAGSGIAVVEVTDRAHKEEVEVPTSVLQEMGRARHFRYGNLRLHIDNRGIPWNSKSNLSLTDVMLVPSLLRTVWLCRIEGWNIENVAFKDADETTFKETSQKMMTEVDEAATRKRETGREGAAWCFIIRFMLMRAQEPEKFELVQWRNREDWIDRPRSMTQTDRTHGASSAYKEMVKSNAKYEATAIASAKASQPTCDLDSELTEEFTLGHSYFLEGRFMEALDCFDRALTVAERTLPRDSHICLCVRNSRRSLLGHGTDAYLKEVVAALELYESRDKRDLLTLTAEEWCFAQQANAWDCGPNGFIGCAVAVLLSLNTTTPGFTKALDDFPPVAHRAIERVPNLIADMHTRLCEYRTVGVDGMKIVIKRLYPSSWMSETELDASAPRRVGGNRPQMSTLMPTDIKCTMRRFIDNYRLVQNRAEPLATDVGKEIHSTKQLAFEKIIAGALTRLPIDDKNESIMRSWKEMKEKAQSHGVYFESHGAK